MFKHLFSSIKLDGLGLGCLDGGNIGNDEQNFNKLVFKSLLQLLAVNSSVFSLQ